MIPALEELSHLLPAVRSVAVQADDDRVAWIQQDRYINYRVAEQVQKRFIDLLRCPRRSRMPCLLLTGVPGMGKTHLIRRFMLDYQPEFDPVTGTSLMQVAATQLPPEPLENDFYEELLVALGLPIFAGSKPGNVRSRARILARQLGLRLLIIDEVQSMLVGTYRQQRIFLNSIRFLTNDLQLPIVCVGTPDARAALLTDQHLADRFAAIELTPWRDGDGFGQLLTTFAAMLPLRLSSDLAHPKVRQRLLLMSEGITVRLFRILEAAAIAAIADGSERISLETLKGDLGVDSLVSMSERRRNTI